MGVSGRNHGTYGSQPCGLRVLSVGVAIIGLGGYTYYTYVGDINPLRGIRRVVETSRGTSLRWGVLSGWGWRRAAARLYIGYETIGYIHIIYVGNILLSVVCCSPLKMPLENQ